MLSSPFIFHLSKCKTTSCVYLLFIFFVCLCLSWLCRKDAKADACAWGMEKGSASPCVSHSGSNFCGGRWGQRWQWWVSSCSPLQVSSLMGDTSLEGSAVSSSSTILVEKIFVEDPRITEVLSLLAWNLHGSPRVPQLLHSLPLPFAGTDTDNVSKSCFFKIYVPVKPRLASVEIRRAF